MCGACRAAGARARVYTTEHAARFAARGGRVLGRRAAAARSSPRRLRPASSSRGEGARSIRALCRPPHPRLTAALPPSARRRRRLRHRSRAAHCRHDASPRLAVLCVSLGAAHRPRVCDSHSAAFAARGLDIDSVVKSCIAPVSSPLRARRRHQAWRARKRRGGDEGPQELERERETERGMLAPSGKGLEDPALGRTTAVRTYLAQSKSHDLPTLLPAAAVCLCARSLPCLPVAHQEMIRPCVCALREKASVAAPETWHFAAPRVWQSLALSSVSDCCLQRDRVCTRRRAAQTAASARAVTIARASSTTTAARACARRTLAAL